MFALHSFFFVTLTGAKPASFQCPDCFFLPFPSRSEFHNDVEGSMIDLALAKSPRRFSLSTLDKRNQAWLLCASLSQPSLFPRERPLLSHCWFPHTFSVLPRPAKKDSLLFKWHPDTGPASSPLPSLNSTIVVTTYHL